VALYLTDANNKLLNYLPNNQPKNKKLRGGICFKELYKMVAKIRREVGFSWLEAPFKRVS